MFRSAKLTMHEAPADQVYATDKPLRNLNATSWEEADSRETQPRRPKVLVVDDQKLIADTISEILDNAGFHVLAAYDGWTALETVGRFHPDYLLCDVLMPRMNGVEVAITVRKMYPAARILLFSGQAGISEILREGQRQGFEFELIAKPIHPLQLIELLKKKD